MKIVYPDYSNSIMNLTNSVRKYYNLNLLHPSLKEADDILNAKKYKNVVIILCDGMGSKILDKHLDKTSFLQAHKIKNITSTFPSTTAAATTSVRTGLSPFETGWVGWHTYYKEYDQDLILFFGEGYYDKVKVTPNPSLKFLPTLELTEELKNYKIKTKVIFPSFGKGMETAKTFYSFTNKIYRFIKNSKSDNTYMYAYWDEPDHLMHRLGTTHNKIHRIIKDIDFNLKRLSKKIDEDTICFVIADHGHIDIDYINLVNYPDFLSTLIRLPTIDNRSASFYVKKDKKEEFVKLFNQYFKKDYKLFTHQEIIDRKLFGSGKKHPKFDDFIGDYHASAITNKCFIYNESYLKSTHAGITDDEMLVPLIAFTGNKKRK